MWLLRTARSRTFVVWGLYHGFFLTPEVGIGAALHRIGAEVQGLLTVVVVVIVGWVLLGAGVLSQGGSAICA